MFPFDEQNCIYHALYIDIEYISVISSLVQKWKNIPIVILPVYVKMN